jgi:NAD(P)-dependent dehydrogenase (short-subunit alcohol dehydrogenase family)
MDNVSSLLDKRALITGASRRIGAAIARKLAEETFNILEVRLLSAVPAIRG